MKKAIIVSKYSNNSYIKIYKKNEKNNTNINNNYESKEDYIPIEKYELLFQDNNFINNNYINNKLINNGYKIIKKQNYYSQYYRNKNDNKNKIKKLATIVAPKNESNNLNEIKAFCDIKSFSVNKNYIEKRESQEKRVDGEHKISPYNFKYFCKEKNRKPLYRAQSNLSHNNNSSEQTLSNNMESNFIRISREANIYTSNAKYIKNKKMLLFDKFNYDNNIYKPDRAKLFDMTRIPIIPNKNSFIYKTTNFRAGHLIKKNSSSSVYEPIFNNSSFLDSNKDMNKNNKSLQFRNLSSNINSPYSFVDNSFQSSKRYRPSNTLYKELMEKKNQTIENYFKKNKEKEKEKNNEDDNEDDMLDKTLLITLYNNISDGSKKISVNDLKKVFYKQIINNKDHSKNHSLLLSRKKNDWGQPLSFPKIFSSNIVFENNSQKERYEKMSEIFLNLKQLMEEYKKTGKLNDLDLLYEFCLSKKIDKKYLSVKNLNNFYTFLEEPLFPIDLNKSLRDNILLALQFDKNKMKQKKIIAKKIFSKISPREIIEKRYKSISEEKNRNKNIGILPLMVDLERQSKINRREKLVMTDRVKIKNELKKELDQIKNEVLNKQKIIHDIQNEKRKIKNDKINYNNYCNEKLYLSNERLYYTWYKNKNSFDLRNFIKKSKLTELYYYNRTKEQLIQEDLEHKYFSFDDKK